MINFHIFKEPCCYEETLLLQEQIRERVINGELDNGLILFLEHKPVYTLGLRGNRSNILASDDFIQREGIEIHKIKRGGDITYHGPGQLVIYPIVNIKKLGFNSIKEFVVWFGEMIASVLRKNYGIDAIWNNERTGIWVKNNKIMATGLHFKNFVPVHGFALNISPNMNHFSGIIPCGITDGGITSIYKENGKIPSYAEVAAHIIESIKEKSGENLMEIELQ